jgi:hypothetical protein
LPDVADITYGFKICSDLGADITLEFVGADVEDLVVDKFDISGAEEISDVVDIS